MSKLESERPITNCKNITMCNDSDILNRNFVQRTRIHFAEVHKHNLTSHDNNNFLKQLEN